MTSTSPPGVVASVAADTSPVSSPTVDVSAYGAGLQLVAVGRTARVRTIRGEVVAESETVITDEDVFALLDADRR